MKPLDLWKNLMSKGRGADLDVKPIIKDAMIYMLKQANLTKLK